jgi:hypothetical protein
MWGALSDEKSGLYFLVFPGHRQRSLSQIWVPLLSLFLRHPQSRGPGSCIYIPQEQGGPVIPSGNGLDSLVMNSPAFNISSRTSQRTLLLCLYLRTLVY